MLFLHWAITFSMAGKLENLCTVNDQNFTCAVEANGFFPSSSGIVAQHWVTLIGVVFSFGFTSAVGATMGFVRLQCLWLSVVRRPLNIQRMHFN